MSNKKMMVSSNNNVGLAIFLLFLSMTRNEANWSIWSCFMTKGRSDQLLISQTNQNDADDEYIKVMS